MEFVIRFLAGGIVVSAFALLGDLLRPKSFAGLFSAAPSVALVTLGLAFHNQGVDYAAAEAWAMVSGSIAAISFSISPRLRKKMRKAWSNRSVCSWRFTNTACSVQ